MFYYSDVNKTLIPALVNKYLCNTINKILKEKRRMKSNNNKKEYLYIKNCIKLLIKILNTHTTFLNPTQRTLPNSFFVSYDEYKMSRRS